MTMLINDTQKALDGVTRPNSGEPSIELRVESHPHVRIWRGPVEDSYGARIVVQKQRKCFVTCRGVNKLRQGITLAEADIQKRRLGKSIKPVNLPTRQATDLYVTPHIEDLKDAKGALSRQRVLHGLVLDDGRTVGDIPVHEHDKATALAILAAAKKGRKPATVKRIMSRYSKDFSIFVEEGLHDVNPCQGIKLPRENNIRNRIFTDLEMRLHTKKALALNTPQGHCQVLASTIGCRIGEAMRMRWSDIQPDGLSVIIQDTKHGGDSVYPLNSAARPILEQCKSWQINGYVFPSTIRAEGYIAYPRESFVKIRAEVMTEAGTAGVLPEYWLHDSRRSFGSKCNSVNGDLRATQQLLNHKSSTTTERYTHHVPKQLADASERTVQALFGDLFNQSACV